jgi:hypothetical protein
VPPVWRQRQNSNPDPQGTTSKTNLPTT